MSADEDLRILRAFEPVVRLTQGEYFVPTSVEGYVRRAALWRLDADGSAIKVAEPGELDLDSLASVGRQLDGPGYSLSGISVQASLRDRIRSWFRAERPEFHSGHRLAQVGLTGRSIDTFSRLSLLLRGSVPGGSALASYQLQNEALDPEHPAYHGRVVRDAGWIVCQYWFFYSFNNWRSAFSGVNEHESDWEQVTVYLDGTGPLDDDGLPVARWVVFSAHDETGDDLRRRWDDPDLAHVDGRHPIVYAGAGSHSGAYLPGDYLITVVPPRLGGIVPLVRRIAKILTPWVRAAQGSGLGIPYIDYARGDGLSIGPGQAAEWTRVLIDDETPWVRDYRGLWGHDTRDRLGGERGPAGPRYERTAVVRQSWGDPVGWAGLGKVAPNPDVALDLVGRRIEEIDAELAAIGAEVGAGREAIAAQAVGFAPDAPEVRALQPEEARLTTSRMDEVRLRDERERMLRAQREGLPDAGPWAHLRHRRTPISADERGRGRLLSAWAVVSTPIILLLIASLFLPQDFARPQVAAWFLIAVLSVEAFVRGYFWAFFWRLLLVLAVIQLAADAITYWQIVGGVGFALLAVVVLVVNIRDALRH